ncbi:MAG: asparagine synthase-related protein [Opitutaceae bacterium]
MFALAFAAGFEDGAPNATRVQAMLAGFPASAPDGATTAEAGHAVAGILRWAVVRRDLWVVPRWDPVRQLLFAGDVRLYNRPELAQLLDLPKPLEELSDLELAWVAYTTWGEETPRHLVGDFAFVVWDEGRHRLFACRDHLGVRPLYYSVMSDGVVVASDVRQLLPLIPRPYDDVDTDRVLRRLLHASRRPGSTFFRSISLVQPGHSLFLERGKKREVRHWDPALSPLRGCSYEENCAELLRLFRRAVRDRLDSEHPLVAHSSGGFDSSTILMASADVYREEPGRPPLVMASALTPGFPCDDGRFIDAVTANVPFEHVSWNVVDTAPTPAALEPLLLHPAFRRGLGSGPRRDLDLAMERGARVLLGGTYGDEVLFAGSVHLDMFRGGRWGELLRETLVLRNPRGRGGRMLMESLLGVLPPPVALRLRKNLFQRSSARPPWLGFLFETMGTPSTECTHEPDRSWPSHLAYTLWSQLTGTKVTGVLDGIILYASEAGLEMRLPFADIRLIEHLLTVPWEQRFPHGHLRRFGRDALGALLPDLFSTRVDQGNWGPVFVANAKRAAPFMAQVLHDGPWHSAPFVDRHKVRGMFQEVSKINGAAAANTWTLVLELVALESWLRALFCYNPREVKTCPIL